MFLPQESRVASVWSIGTRGLLIEVYILQAFFAIGILCNKTNLRHIHTHFIIQKLNKLHLEYTVMHAPCSFGR